MDWSDGEYEETAATLVSVADVVCDAAAVTRGARVLDVGCGTGNASLAAARRGAVVTGLDPAARLVDVARKRAGAEGLEVSFVNGEAGALPFADASFDVVLSVFAVIFAPDPAGAATELLRVAKPGGAIVATTWGESGGIAEAGKVLMTAARQLLPANAPPRAAPRWGDPAFVRSLFEPAGARVSVAEHSLTFTHDSPEAWFEAQTTKHPAWRAVRKGLQEAGLQAAWEGVQRASVEALTRWNEDPRGLRVTSRYFVVRVDR